LNRDPIGEAGGINLYRAMGNNQVNNIDPYGLAYHFYGNPADFPPGMSPLVYGDTASEKVFAAFGDIGGSILNGVGALGNLFHWGASQAVGESDANGLLLAVGIPEANLPDSLGVGAGLLGDAMKGASKCVTTADKFSRQPMSLMDQMVLDAAKQGNGLKIIDNLGDPAFKGMEKWSYGETSANGLRSEVHYVLDPNTGQLMDFKFKINAATFK
jgi:hypothetical protein